VVAGLISTAPFGDVHRGIGCGNQLGDQFNAIAGPVGSEDAGRADAGSDAEG